MMLKLKTQLPNLFRYAALALAVIGLIVSLFAPGWWTALAFAALLVYLWRAPKRPTQAPPTTTAVHSAQRRNEPADYRALEWKGLIFRSESEIKIAKALDHRGIFFIPPARVRLNAGKPNRPDGRQTRELDFIICHEGKWGVLEVDGPFHVAQADAERDAMLRTHGITSIQRFPSLRCFQQPNAVIDEFLFELEERG